MGSLIVAIAIVVAAAYLMWQLWEADLLDQG